MTEAEIPPPPVPENAAVFLDFDGTLVGIAPTPDTIVVPDHLAGLLSRLAKALGGALAVVSGRPVAEIDRWLAPASLPAAGLHGLETRRSVGGEVERAPTSPEIEALRERLAATGLYGGGVVLEDKGLGFAIHYRAAPEREREVIETVDEAAAPFPNLAVIHGKMVVEAKQKGHDKGTALAAFMERAPFAGRTPVFVGDDTTDEDGFRFVNGAGGVSVKVGDGKTAARYALPDVPAVHAYLARLAEGAA